MAETTLEQLAGLLQMVARHGELTGDPRAEMPEFLARRVKQVTEFAHGLERALATVRPRDGAAMPGVVQDGLVTIPTYQSVWGFVEAIHHAKVGKGWTDGNGATAPMYRFNLRHAGEMYVSYRGSDDDFRPRDEVRAALWAQVRELDDLESDTLLVCLAHWATHSRGPDEAVWVNVNAVLDARNIQRKRYATEGKRWTHGHRQDDRVDVGRAFTRLDHLWLQMVDVEVVPGSKRRKPQRITVESKALAMTDRMNQYDLDGRPVPAAVRVMPGSWAREYWERDLKWRGLLAQKALEYDPYRQQPEKRLAKYLAFHFRIDAHSAREVLRRRVEELLDNAGMLDAAGQLTDSANPQRARGRFEAALDRLREDDVISGWQYDREPLLPSKQWVNEWRRWTVILQPPSSLRARYLAGGLGNFAVGPPADPNN
ncbi:MAG: hypothetical protein JO352_03720 [Chloroflexi bacterium]|nr:hypothetical protein [Chloroflexota bacterium]MBV9602668.1 hypothetical protein [Chloroflexota bacterium]